MWKLLNEDIEAYAHYASDFFGKKPGFLRKLGIFLTPSILCCFMYRLAHKLWQWKLRPLARWLSNVNYIIHKAWINPAVEIQGGLYIPHTVGILVEGHAGKNLTVYACAVLGAQQNQAGINTNFARVGDHVSLGVRSIVYAGVRIGKHAKIGPNALVRTDIEDYATVFSMERTQISAQTSERLS